MTTKQDWIKIAISSAIITKTLEIVKTLPIYRKSHRKEQANFVGTMGEVVVMEYLETLQIKYDKDYTVNNDISIKGHTVDIKTKERSVSPLPHYECTVPAYLEEAQLPEFYIFVSLERSKNPVTSDVNRIHTAWILGFITYQQFHQRAEFIEEGRTEQSGARFFTAAWNIPISTLVPMIEIEKWSLISN